MSIYTSRSRPELKFTRYPDIFSIWPPAAFRCITTAAEICRVVGGARTSIQNRCLPLTVSLLASFKPQIDFNSVSLINSISSLLFQIIHIKVLLTEEEIDYRKMDKRGNFVFVIGLLLTRLVYNKSREIVKLL